MDKETWDYLRKKNHYLIELSIGYHKQGFKDNELRFKLFKIADELMEGSPHS